MTTIKIVEKFSGENSEEYNVIATALIECGKDRGSKSEYPEYDFIENTPRTSLVVFLVNKLKEMGYKLVKQNQEI